MYHSINLTLKCYNIRGIKITPSTDVSKIA